LFIIRHNKLVIGLILVAIILSFIFIPRLRIVNELKNFYIEGDPDLQFYNEYTRVFGSSDNILMIAIHNEKGIYNYDLLKKIREFTADCRRIHNVVKANAITNIRGMLVTPTGLMTFPLLHYRDTLRYAKDSTRISREPLVHGRFVSSDARTAIVFVEVEQGIDIDSKDKIILEIDKLITEYSFPETHIAGTVNYEVRYFRMVGSELVLNIFLCGFVIFTSLILIFRTFSGVLVPALTVIIVMIFLYGFLGLFNKPITALSTIFPTIMLVVSLSNLIHILSKYRDSLAKGIKKKQAIIETFIELRLTIFLTSATTAIGFFSLSISAMKPFRNFGFEAGIGVLIAFIVAITFVPSALLYIKPASFYQNKRNLLAPGPKLLDGVYSLVIRYPRRIIFITILVLSASLIGILRINTNSYILSNFSNKAQIKKDFVFFEEHFCGVRVHEMAIMVQNGDSISDIRVLREIEKLHSFLEEDQNFQIIFSPVTVYKFMNQVNNGGVPAAFKLAESQSQIDEYDEMAIRINRELYHNFIDSSKTMGRLFARMKDIGSERMKEFYDETDSWIGENVDSNTLKFRNTGSTLLADKSNAYLTGSMLVSLMLAFIIVSLIMILLFMNIKMVIISLIPNIIPLVIVAGIIGFTGIVFNGLVSIIFTIGFVIAVDDTIHFLSKFKIELSKGQNVDNAIRTTLRETGKAIVITSIVLLFGFMILLHSDMKEAYYQGLLVSFMLITALLGDLFLLPVLIRYLIRDKKRN
jgi:predicted RND superfamily exporter protein